MSKIRRLDKVEVSRNARIKTIRTAVRLKHALNADAELNDLLPNELDRFDDNVSKGKLIDNTTIFKALSK